MAIQRANTKVLNLQLEATGVIPFVDLWLESKIQSDVFIFQRRGSLLVDLWDPVGKRSDHILEHYNAGLNLGYPGNEDQIQVICFNRI